MKKIFITLALITLLTGCSSDNSITQSTSDSAMSSTATMPESFSSSTSDKSITSDEMSEKISYTVDISLETKEFDENLQLLDQAIEKYDGFIEKSSVYGDTERVAQFTVRIPTEDYLDFLTELENTGNVYNTNTTTENLTSEFIDVNARLTTLELEESRLLDLLEIAENLEDIITIEERLSEVRYQIESYTTSLRVMTLKVDYSTINIEIYEVVEYQKNDSFLQEITITVRNSFSSLLDSLKGVVIFIIYVAPFLVVWSCTILILYLVFRKPVKKVKNFIKNAISKK